jgi:methylenetetrahydrofolate dehydrogenase (NADP+)/methenyltetrahydrofolate cyclohydrolase
MVLLDGKACAADIKIKIHDYINEHDLDVSLAVIQVGDDPASSVYVRNKERACEECDIRFLGYHLPEDVPEGKLINLIKMLNHADQVNGILVQLPLPKHINVDRIIETIDPAKDVDGFHPINVGRRMTGAGGFAPCTAAGIVELLKHNDIDLRGMNCVVVGRSNIVGKPVAVELLHEDATVTICHSKTYGLENICRRADVVICAIGKPEFFNGDYFTSFAIVVDVGIHRKPDGKLCGDVEYDDVAEWVRAITPVPGGVGPMTVAMLMKNTLKAAGGDIDV